MTRMFFKVVSNQPAVISNSKKKQRTTDKHKCFFFFVIPAKAGIQGSRYWPCYLLLITWQFSENLECEKNTAKVVDLSVNKTANMDIILPTAIGLEKK